MKVFIFLKELVLMTIGCIIASFGISCFLLPNHLSSGGFAGIATILYYLFNIKMGVTIILLNIPVFIAGYLITGKKFMLKTLYSTFLYSKFIDIFENTIKINDMLLGSVYGGIFIGVGIALVLKAESSTGGTELIATLTQNYKKRCKNK